VTVEIEVTVPTSGMNVEVTGTGAPGAPGSDGADGLSAYQIAQLNGFLGTEAQWLASLKGADGAPGPSAVSTDAGNSAVLGTDDLIYVPASSGASNWGDLGGTLSDQTDLQAALDAKADTISLGTAATHAATDFATAAQGTLADSALQSAPVTSVNTKVGAVTLTASDVGASPTGAYVKPAPGIPSTDMTSAVQASLGKADTALQTAPVTSVNTKTGAVVLTASDVGASPTGAYVKPGTGIPKTDLATAVQISLGLADTALQSAPVASVAGKTGVVTLVEGDIANLTTDLAAKAPLASPAFTGNPTVPTQTAGDSSTKAASTAFVATAVAGVTFNAADYTHTTTSLANGAYEASTFTLSSAQVHEALKVTTDRAARVRLYASTTQRDADVARAVGTDPTGDHGLLLEANFASATSAIVTVGSRLFEASAFGAVPCTITNSSGSTSTVAVTIKAKGV